MVNTIKAGEFKAKCLAIMDEVARSRNPVIVTKHGKPVVKIIPAEEIDKNRKPLKGCVVYMGDVISPVGEQWEAEKIDHA